MTGDATCTPPTTTDIEQCNNIALVDSTQFGSRDIELAGAVGSGPYCTKHQREGGGTLGCQLQFQRDITYTKPDGSKVSEGTYSYPNGQSSPCNPAATAPAAPADKPEPDTCKNGQSGTVNGVTVCIPFSNGTPVEASKPPVVEGSKNSTGQDVVKTTSESTSCNGAGSCTTTTIISTSTAGGAPVVETKAITESRGTLCARDPANGSCGSASGNGEGDGSEWGGNCEAGFTCSGDAVQCALAKEVHLQNCLMNKPTDESALYEAAKAKTGDQTTDLPGNETKAITSADIDQTNAIVGGMCIQDRTININLIVTTTTLVLPFSSICPLLEYFRWVLIALGFFIGYRIIGGR